MDPLFAQLLAEYGVNGTLGVMALLFIFLMFTGRVIPISQFKDKDADRDYWKTAYETEREASKKAIEVAHALLENGKTTEHFLNSLPTGEPHSKEET